MRRVDIGEGTYLDVLPIGPAVDNPSNLLANADLAGLFARLRAAYDLIVIDSPPMNVVAEAAFLAPHSDAVMVVARAGVTTPEALDFTIEQLGNMPAPVWTVLNDMDYRRDRAYGAYRYQDSHLAPQGE